MRDRFVVDYDYYVTEYKGSLLTEERFYSIQGYAYALVNRLTFSKLSSLIEIDSNVKNAICFACEECISFCDSRSGGVSSESNDGYSVSYLSPTDKFLLQSNVLSGIRTYLSTTGLLYRGVY